MLQSWDGQGTAKIVSLSVLFGVESSTLFGIFDPPRRRIVMKALNFAFYFFFAIRYLCAAEPSWEPSPGHTQVPIWPVTVPTPSL
jgi:hypothetical protein